MASRRAQGPIALAGLAALFAFCLSPAALRADTLERIFIMPGPVIESHAEFESDCKSCHAPLSDISQRELCVACHEDVGADIAGKSGFHGRDPQARADECSNCHTDHEGRDAQTVILDPNRFNHGFTDFPLLGAHADAGCAACHVEGATHRSAPVECVACHREDDRHEGALGEACGDCHNAADWRFVRFDHAKTGFPLTGGHKTTTCEACHKTEDYSATPRDCVACHGNDDIHRGKNGKQCGDCHVTANWTKVTFDHMSVTNFPLLGGHAGLTCQDCHSAEDFAGLVAEDCNACHRNDDVHDGRNGSDCGSCHEASGWGAVAFDHFKSSGFALLGSHQALQCTTCHVGNVQETLPRDCGGCHADDDTHAGQLGAKCEGCHGQIAWTANLRFDHDLARFPLIGLHAEVACDRCHATSAFHDAPENCSDCHRSDDPHRGAFGEQCETCHSPRDWAAWVFDHDTQTDFALTGGHIGIACEACHAASVDDRGPPTSPRDCASCHRRDDPHLGRFGDACASCHTTASFREAEGM